VPCSWWANKRVSELELQTPLTITPSVSCKEAVNLMTREGYSMVPVVSEDNKVQQTTHLSRDNSNVFARPVRARCSRSAAHLSLRPPPVLALS
jgi:cystathionine beta-synthase